MHVDCHYELLSFRHYMRWTLHVDCHYKLLSALLRYANA